jgi:hypothetical protein
MLIFSLTKKPGVVEEEGPSVLATKPKENLEIRSDRTEHLL